MASRLRLNPAKTQIMWLGTSQQLDKITVRDVPLLSTEVFVVNSACNLGIIIDSQLSLDAHVAAVCRSGYYQLRQLRPMTGLCRCCQDTIAGLHIQSIGLLQRTAVWRV